MSDIVRWETPPDTRPGGRGRESARRMERTIVELQLRPGQWALVVESGSASQAHTFRKHGCEATSRRVDDTPDGRKRWAVWARWPEPALVVVGPAGDQR